MQSTGRSHRQKYIQSVDELHRATSAHVAAIHHSGWDGERGKGAIDLDGAIDVSFGISVSGKGESKSFVLECTGANDGQDGVVTGFRLESVPLGVDADGNETTAPVVVPVKVTPASLTTTVDGLNLKGESFKAFESLRAVAEEDGEPAAVGSPGFPEGILTVTRDAWRNRFYADVVAKEPAIDTEALRKRFQRTSVKLIEAGNVGAMGDRVWLP